MLDKSVIIQGSARSIGNTQKIVKVVSGKTGFDIIDLSKYVIGQYDYEKKGFAQKLGKAHFVSLLFRKESLMITKEKSLFQNPDNSSEFCPSA